MVIGDNNACAKLCFRLSYNHETDGPLVRTALSISPNFWRVCLWLSVAVAIIIAPRAFASEPLDVSAPPHFKILDQAEIVREDLTTLTLDEALTRAANGSMPAARESTGDPTRPNSPESIDLVYGPVWATLDVTNPTAKRMNARLDTRAGILNNILDAYIVRDDQNQSQIWANNWLEKPYDQQSPQMRLRASTAFSLDPGETIQLWIHYPYGFYIHEELWLINEQDFVERRTGDAGYAAFFFGWRAALIISVFAFAVILKSRLAMYYGLFAAALFAFFLENYGFTYTYLFRSFKADQIWFTSTGGLAFTFFGLMCRDFLNAPRLYPMLNRVLTWTMVLGWGVAVISMLLGPHPLSQMLLLPVVVIFVGVCIYGTVLGVRNQHPGAVLFLIATVMLFANCFFGLLTWPPLYLIPAQVNIDVTHAGFSLDAFLFAGALVSQALALRRERDSAHLAQIAALKEKAKIATQLNTVSANYEHASALAETRRKALAEASHDLKQPLLSLQLSLRNREDVEAVSQGISYMQSVVDKTLRETHPNNAGAPKTVRIDRVARLETVFQNVVTMFSDEAKDKGIELKMVASSATIKAEPVILMRLLTNLVANAIKHTDSGRVLVGAKRHGETISVQIWDTGHGVSAEQLKTIFDPYVSGAASSGEGLGLSVVKALAEANNWTVRMTSHLGQGSMVEISGLQLMAPS